MDKREISIGALATLLAAGVAATHAGSVDALVPSDPQGGHAAYASLNLPAAWELTTGSPNVVVAVVDSGLDPSHPDLGGAVRSGYDFVDDDGDAADPPGFGHGTAVAGVVAARANNGIGGMGTCFRCDILPLRVIGLDGFALNTNTAAAIDYAVDHGAAVVNASIYGERSPQVLRDAIVRARAAGVLVVAAAGNEANTRPQYPAAFPEAIAVASATAAGPLATFSSRGEWVDFAAPECAPITTLGGGSDIGCATSVSSPLVAGIVALLRARAPFATAAELEEALAGTARPVAGTRYGLVDAAAALARLGTPPARLAPTISGRAVAGEELEGFTGVWVGAGLTPSYQWERCRDTCTPIPNGTTPRYTPIPSDGNYTIRLSVSDPRAGAAVSPETSPVGVKPASTRPPSISGPARVGKRLLAQRGSWAGTNLRFVTRWLRCSGVTCVPASPRGQYGARYRVRPVDRGKRLRVEVTALNDLGLAIAASRATPVVR